MTLRSILPCRHRTTPPCPLTGTQFEKKDIAANVDNTPRALSTAPNPTLISTTESPGTKRKRSGRLISLILNRRGQHSRIAHPFDAALSLSESESEDSSSSSESDFDSDCDHESEDSDEEDQDDDAAQEHILDRDPELGSLRGPLLQLAYNNVKSWMASTRYVAPPQDRLPPHKRSRTANWRPRSTYLVQEEEEEDHSNSEVVISRVDGYFHLACPFYISNLIKYRPCLLQHDLQTIEDVINHLQQHHMKPLYCPMCNRTFDRLLERDNHIRARICEFTDSGDIDGINEYQEARLSKRDRLYYSEKKRWLRLWGTVFPKMELPRSPYLEDDGERELSMVRDYWATHGGDIVTRFLASRSLPSGDQLEEERVQTALYQSTLEDLLGKISEEHWAT